MTAMFLLDTDVLIDYLRGRAEAVSYLNNLTAEMLISVVTIAELYAGVREGKEQIKLETFMRAFEIVPIDYDIAVAGGLYRRDYGKSHGTGFTDALIAATAEVRGAQLVTLNHKHFPMLANRIIIPYRKT